MVPKSYSWIAAGIILLAVVAPVSAGTKTVIYPGATVFAGEEGLDISAVMGGWMYIAWWSPTCTTFPIYPTTTYLVDSPSNFVVGDIQASRPGKWYAYDTIDSVGDASSNFTVADPSVAITVRRSTNQADVSGGSVQRGTSLGFRLVSNMYLIDNGLRANAAGDSNGYMDIVVTDPSGTTQYTTLSSNPLTGFNVNLASWPWDYIWNTGDTGNSTSVYPTGTYTVYAYSDLNGMKIPVQSPSTTITLLPEPSSIAITAAGDQSYYFGEDIRFLVNVSGPGKVAYLFMTGPGLPAQGARLSLDPASSPVENGSPSSFTNPQVVLDTTDFTLSQYIWQTVEDLPLGAGTYTIYAAAAPFDLNNLSGTDYNTVSIILKKPFISAAANRYSGPVGTVFHFSGTREGGMSPGSSVFILMTNNTPPLVGGLPADGVRPDDLANLSISRRNESFAMPWVYADRSWSYDWDTSRIQHGSLLPGSQYLFYVMMQPLTVTDAKANGGYTRLELGIEGPVHADFSVNAWNGTTVEFHDLSTGMPSTALFDFGDGLLANITPGSRVNHTYLDAGTFSVKLTVGNTLGTDSVTKQVTVVGTTRDDAYTEVLTDPDILNNDVTGKAVYTSQNPVEAGSTVTGWSTDFGVNTNGWLIFIDDHPKANWEHPVRYVLVDDNNRRTLFQGTSPPKNVAISQIAGVVPTVGSTNDVGSGYSAGYTGGGGGNTVCSQIACPHCYALLVSGGFDRDNNFDRYWNDLSSMYRTLRQTYCYAPDHIQVLMSDGNDPGLDQRTGNGPNDYADSRTDFDGSGHSEVNAAATKDNLVQALTGYQSSLTSADSLFIFTSNHGGKDPNSDNVRLWLWNQEYMWDYEFAGYLNQIPAKVIALTMEQCYSGGFVDNVMASVPAGQTRVIATAASATEPSYGNDFSYWWIDGSMGPAGNPNYNLNAVADGLVSLREDFDYADQHDPSAAQGYEHPQYSGGATADAGLATGLSSCSQCPDPKPVPDPTKPGAFLPYAPGDPLGMGINEDLYGRGSFNQDDAVLFFRDFGWMQANEPVCGFDVNGNRRIDFADIVKLYQEAQ